jgi:hypothetical protein
LTSHNERIVKDSFKLTDRDREVLVRQVVDAASERLTQSAARGGLFFAAGVCVITGVDKETFLNACADDYDAAKGQNS